CQAAASSALAASWNAHQRRTEIARVGLDALTRFLDQASDRRDRRGPAFFLPDSCPNTSRSLHNPRHEPRLRDGLVLDQPAGELPARLHAELAEDACQVVLHRVLADLREARNLAVALAELDPLRDLRFALAQRRQPFRAPDGFMRALHHA